MRLIEAIQIIGRSLNPSTPQQSGGGGAGAFFDTGVVESVSPLGILSVKLWAGTVTATPVTDEPIKPGMLVWVSQSSEGYLVHGGVR
jgi:hypothetical protein